MKKENQFKKFLSLYRIILILFFAVALIKESQSAQDTVKIFSGKDNTLYESHTGNVSNGMGMHFFSGTTQSGDKRRGLVKFNFQSVIPPCANVVSVTLRLHMSRTISGNQNIELRKVSEDWGEGASVAPSEEGYGAAAETGDATWTNTFYNDQFWSDNGGTFLNTVSGTKAVGGNGYYTWGTTSQMVNDVQGWVNNPSGNFGWLLFGNESLSGTAKRFDTKENDSVSFRPVLTVIFTTSNFVSVNLSSIMEGFWNGTLMVRDTMKVYLRNSVSPYIKKDSSKAFMNSFGNASYCFSHAGSGSYYVVVSQRNSINTWSKFPQSLTAGGFSSYDFTGNAASAYGNNEVFKLGKYCLYSGDVNKDGIIDLTDTQLIDNDSYNFISGYISTDVNGDNYVDVSDASIADNNSSNFVGEIAP